MYPFFTSPLLFTSQTPTEPPHIPQPPVEFQRKLQQVRRGGVSAAQILMELGDLIQEAKAAGDRSGEFLARATRGSFLRLSSQFQEARTELDAALALFQGVTPVPLEVRSAEIEVALLALQAGDIAVAEPKLLALLEVFTRTLPLPAKRAQIQHYLGILYDNQGRLELAIPYHRDALQFHRSAAPNGPETAASLGSLGTALVRAGQVAEGERLLQESLAIYDALPEPLQRNPMYAHEQALIRLNLGFAASRSGKKREAEKWFAESVDRISHSPLVGSVDHASAVLSLATTRDSLGEYTAAEKGYLQARAMLEARFPDSKTYTMVLSALGALSLKRGEDAAAVPLFEKAAEIFEARLARSVDGQQLLLVDYDPDPFLGLVAAYTRLHQADKAFLAAERPRARQLANLMDKRAQTQADKALPAPLKTARDAARERLATAYGALAQLGSDSTATKQATVLQEQIARCQRDLNEIEAQSRAQGSPVALVSGAPTALGAVQELLSPSSRFLSFVASDTQLYRFVVGRRGATQVTTVPVGENTLRERVRAFRKIVIETRTGSAAALRKSIQEGHALYQLLFDGLALTGVDRLVLSLDGLLATLPLPALVAGGTDTAPVYLSDRFALQGTPSAALYVALQKRSAAATPAPEALCVVVDPAYPETPPASVRGGIPTGRLAGSRREGESIRQHLGTNGSFLEGTKATEAEVRSHLGRARLVHLGCHGFLNDRDPMASGLVLLPSAGDDGLVQAWELYGPAWRLNTSLLVLSACETGLGSELRGEGIQSLTRAFHVAGARAIAYTLWRVNDQATPVLLDAFYTKLALGAPPDRALQAAMQKTRQIPATKAPYFWAGFALSGETSSPIAKKGH